MLSDYLQQLMRKENLSETQCQKIVTAMLDGAPPEQIAALLVLLHSKPESSEELTAIVRAMQSHMIPVQYEEPLLDIVGTGGDNANTVNISTAAALLVSSLGITVAKHGNRSVSSKCGSADLIESLNIPIHASAAEAKQLLVNSRFAFLFAPDFHPAMKSIKAIRQALRIRTTFNLIGPLLNPARPSHIIIGVYDKNLLDAFADVLQKLGVSRALVVHGNGLDEINCLGPVDIVEVAPQEKKRYQLDPRDFGLRYCSLSDLQGGNPVLNRKLLLTALSSTDSPITETLLFNAGIAVNLINPEISIREGIQRARTAIEKGIVLSHIKRLSEVNYARLS